MSNSEYFCGTEAERFSFFRIPRALMKDARFRDLSTDAKLLYGLMLDRMSLSRRSGWLDEQNRVFIYFTLDEIQEVLACGHNKATHLLVELEKCVLIERVRQGQGKPAKIYIKNFIVPESNEPETSPETDIKTSENPTSVLPVFSPLDCPKGAGIYTDKNDTEFSYINLSINPKEQQPTSAQVRSTPPCLPLAKQAHRSHTAPLAALYEQVCHLLNRRPLLVAKPPNPRIASHETQFQNGLKGGDNHQETQQFCRPLAE